MKELKITQIKETCIYVNDLERTKEFYHKKLRLPVISFMENRHIFFRAGSSVLLCFNPEATMDEEKLPPHYGSGHLHFAFEVEREAYEDAKKFILDQNIIITHEENWGSGIKSFYFNDPDNHVVEIVMKGLWD